LSTVKIVNVIVFHLKEIQNAMKSKTILPSLLVCLSWAISTTANAQTLYDLDTNIDQPEYAPVNVYGKPNVDSQGNLNLSYTLGQVESHGFSYPIAFNYQSGIQALSPANWIGLGWTYNPGSITRIPAVGNPKSAFNIFENDNFNYIGIDVFDQKGANPQTALPDMYQVVIPGKGAVSMMQILEPNYTSSTIPAYSTGDFVPLDQNGWKIAYQSAVQTIDTRTTGIYSDNFTLQSQKADFSKFLISTPDGMSYLFASPTLGFTMVREKNGTAYNNRNQVHVQTWRLVAIFGAEYTADRWQVPVSSNNQPWIKLEYGSVLSATQNQTLAFRQTQYLASVTSPVASATFNTTSRYEPMLPWWERSIGISTTQRKLTSIALSYIGSSPHKTITLTHDNSFSPTPPSNPDKGRLKLLSINDSMTEGLDYSFKYYAPSDSIKWNGFDTQASSFNNLFVDYYGYFNKSSQAALYNGNASVPSSQNESQSWSLASVSYNTGLKDSIFYEARFITNSQKASFKRDSINVILNKIYDPMDRDAINISGTYVGGPRISAIFRNSRYDEFATDANELFTYQYLDPKIGSPPTPFIADFFGSNTLNVANYTNQSIQHVEVREFQHESVLAYDSTNPLPPTKKTIRYTYQSPSSSNAVLDTDFFGSTQGVYLTQDLSSTIEWKLTGVFDNSGGLDNSESSTYAIAEFGATDAGLMAASWGLRAAVGSATFTLATVKSSRGQKQSSSKKFTDQRELYAYSYEPQTGLLRERHRKQAGVGKPYQVQRYTYGFEQYTALQTRNILSAVVRIDAGLANSSGLVSWKSAQVTTWALATDPTDEPLAFWKPKASFSWNSASPVNGSPVAFNAYSSHIAPVGWVKPSHYRYDRYSGRLAQEFFPNSSYVLFTYGLNSSRLTNASLYRSGLPTLSTQMEYFNAYRKLSKVTSVSGQQTRYSYDPYGRLSQVRNLDNNLVQAYDYAVDQSAFFGQYKGLNRIITSSFTYPTGGADTTRIRTAEYYDSLGRLRQRLASNPSEENTLQLSQYNNISQLVKAYLPYQTGLSSSLDFVNEPAAESAALSFYSSLYGVSIANVKPYEQLTYFTNSSDIVKTQASPTINLSTSVQLAYPYTGVQINGQPLEMQRATDQLGHVSLRYTNHFGQLLRTVAAEGTTDQRTTNFAYDELGNLLSATSPKGLITTYTYDSRSLLRSKKLPDQSQSHQYRYNASGQLRFHQNPNQYATPPGTHSYSYSKYDGFGRLTEQGIYTGSVAISAADPENASFPSGGSASARQTYSYDGTDLYSGFSSANQSGKLTREGYYTGDGWGYSYYEYDSRGRVTRQAQVLPGLAAKIIAYSYDTLDRLSQLSYQVGQADDFYQKYAYDVMGRIHQVQSSLDGSSWSTDLQNLSFNQNGALSSQRLGALANPTNEYSYHIQGWLAGMNDPNNLSAGRRFGFELSYQANGNVQSQRWRQSMNLRSSALQYNCVYNSVDYLTSAAFSGGGYSSSAYDVSELAYDLDGNFTRIRRNNQTGVGLMSHLNLSYSAGTNKISQMEDPNPIDFYNFGYDAAGNMNLASHLSLSGASYDERNLPVEFNYQVNKRLTCPPWWMGYDAGALRAYKADQLGNTTHFVRDLNGSVIASYYNGALRYHGLLGPDGSLIGQADGTNRFYFLKDHLGSVRTTVDFTNTALGYDDYYPFGKIMPGRSSSTSTPEDDYKFTGHQRDAEIGLDYMLARNYDPLIGRFMQVDPLAGDYPSITPYGYVLNNPLGLVDPTGMAATDPPFGNGWLKSMVKQLEGYYMGVNTFSDRNYVNTMQSGIGNDLGNAAYFGGNTLVDATATTADFVSDGSTLTAAGGIGLTLVGGLMVGTGFGAVPGAAMMSTGATITGTALTVGTVADATSTVAKGVDAVAFDGSMNSFITQGSKLGVNLLGSVFLPNAGATTLRYFERATQATRRVPASLGMKRTMNTAADATQVALPTILFNE